MPRQFTNAELESYLDESLPEARMTEVESALRSDSALAERLAAVVGRRDAGVHSLGAVWRRHRVSCPTREQLGSFVLGVLDKGFDGYVRFHLETVGCRYCNASVGDLRAKESAAEEESQQTRRRKYFHSSAGYLSSGK